jgi:hypothetical protein
VDGSWYSKNAILAIRYGLQKHFAASRGFDFVNNKQDFPSSNAMFSAVLVELKLSGKKVLFSTRSQLVLKILTNCIQVSAI